MHDFLLVVENAAECPNRLSRIVDAFNAARSEIADKQAQSKAMFCRAALTLTYMKQAEDLIAQINAIIASVKDGTATSTRTVVDYTTDIESFKRDISVAEALLRSIYPKKPTIFSFSSQTGKRRQKFTGQTKIHNVDISYASMISEGATSDPLTAWRKAFIENMLKSNPALDKAVREGRITYTQPQPPAPPAAVVDNTADVKKPEITKADDKADSKA